MVKPVSTLMMLTVQFQKMDPEAITPSKGLASIESTACGVGIRAGFSPEADARIQIRSTAAGRMRPGRNSPALAPLGTFKKGSLSLLEATRNQ